MNAQLTGYAPDGTVIVELCDGFGARDFFSQVRKSLHNSLCELVDIVETADLEQVDEGLAEIAAFRQMLKPEQEMEPGDPPPPVRSSPELLHKVVVAAISDHAERAAQEDPGGEVINYHAIALEYFLALREDLRSLMRGAVTAPPPPLRLVSGDGA